MIGATMTQGIGMRKQKQGFEGRLAAVQDRYGKARTLFDRAVDELEASAGDFSHLECAIQNQIEELQARADEAANGAAQAHRVARKLRELLS